MEILMKQITLGSTGITVPQNGFGALPIQRISTDEAAALVRGAFDGGMTFFDTARAYTDSEVKMGKAIGGIRDKMYIASKTQSKNADGFWSDLEQTLTNLGTDYLDIYQFHCVDQCYAPGDGTGMYEAMLEAKKQGKIKHIGITTHKIAVAEEICSSGLYETLQYPLSYLSTEREIRLTESCREHDMGYIAMKGLAGGLITRADAAMAFMTQFGNVIPIWGIQKKSELDEWLSFFEKTPEMNDEIMAFIDEERKNLSGDFCRGCGYCMPCPQGIQINNCARMALMIRRAPSEAWLNDYWQSEMKKIENCVNCGSCMKKCPYELNTPQLLRDNLADYEEVLAGRISVR